MPEVSDGERETRKQPMTREDNVREKCYQNIIMQNSTNGDNSEQAVMRSVSGQTQAAMTVARHLCKPAIEKKIHHAVLTLAKPDPGMKS